MIFFNVFMRCAPDPTRALSGNVSIHCPIHVLASLHNELSEVVDQHQASQPNQASQRCISRQRPRRYFAMSQPLELICFFLFLFCFFFSGGGGGGGAGGRNLGTVGGALWHRGTGAPLLASPRASSLRLGAAQLTSQQAPRLQARGQLPRPDAVSALRASMGL